MPNPATTTVILTIVLYTDIGLYLIRVLSLIALLLFISLTLMDKRPQNNQGIAMKHTLHIRLGNIWRFCLILKKVKLNFV